MNFLKKISTKLIVICSVFLLISLVCTPKVTLSANGQQSISAEGGSQSSDTITIESARQRIADFARNFALTEGSKCYYYGDRGYQSVRANTYNGGYPQSTYRFDCVGFVSCMIHWSIGLDNPSISNGLNGFVHPNGPQLNTPGIFDTSHFGYVDINSIQPRRYSYSTNTRCIIFRK